MPHLDYNASYKSVVKAQAQLEKLGGKHLGQKSRTSRTILNQIISA
jgi:hypothetical protein